MFCERCKKEFFVDFRKNTKTPARFCSSACARGNNKRYYEPDSVRCLNCDKSLGFGYKLRTKKYCSLLCQQKHQSASKLKVWLETGKIPNFTGGQSGASPKSYVRRYIDEKQGGCCAVCKTSNTWLSKPLVMVLDHINGDSTDNSEGNLRLICPNCDSQTPTIKNRNQGKGRRSRGFTTNKGL